MHQQSDGGFAGPAGRRQPLGRPPAGAVKGPFQIDLGAEPWKQGTLAALTASTSAPNLRMHTYGLTRERSPSAEQLGRKPNLP